MNSEEHYFYRVDLNDDYEAIESIREAWKQEELRRAILRRKRIARVGIALILGLVTLAIWRIVQ